MNQRTKQHVVRFLREEADKAKVALQQAEHEIHSIECNEHKRRLTVLNREFSKTIRSRAQQLGLLSQCRSDTQYISEFHFGYPKLKTNYIELQNRINEKCSAAEQEVLLGDDDAALAALNSFKAEASEIISKLKEIKR